MSGQLVAWNTLSEEEAVSWALALCGSHAWARCLARSRPLDSRAALLGAADACWGKLARSQWLEAFAAHPRIGDRAASGLAAREQSGARSGSSETLVALERANREYEDRFGWIFLVCARGKTAEQMLSLCRERLHNEPRTELGVAAEEQKKITRLRLEDWLA
ncbi:MAG TPA: 2-oxo-4-hydroxy-4-carboxy-5-ureidoimidazoline decarboxylase [Thermoanaerobaculia bacterium]